MAKAVMVLGTTSNAGKSLMVGALCRIYKNRGYKVAPFKAQNMALNSYITADGGEMGRAQVMQAECAGIEPQVEMNPILLKPSTDRTSQVILMGKVQGNLSAKEYYKKKEEYLPVAVKAYNKLAEEYDIIFLEGAGSPSEINLKDVDIVNMGFAKAVDVPAVIVGDIDRGGVFASLAGTMLLFDEEERERTKGLIINKFRGDESILTPGVKQLEEITKKPVLGVVHYLPVDIDEEDSLSSKLTDRSAGGLIDIAVLRLPRISNFTDVNVFSLFDGVHVRYITNAREFGNPDLLIIPGSKSTMDDLTWVRESGLDQRIIDFARRGGYVVGICGGYQMLGESLRDPDGVEGGGEMAGLGLLPSHTTFAGKKKTTRTSATIQTGRGLFEGLEGEAVHGYEIHMGRTIVDGTPFLTIDGEGDGCIENNVAGTYLHGFFDNENIVRAIVERLYREKGYDGKEIAEFDLAAYKEEQYERLAKGVEEALDMDLLDQILGLS